MKRREFIGEASCGAMAGSAALGSLLNLNLIGNLAADEVPDGDDYRALVCVFLAGGNDSFNMLVPHGVGDYAEYAAIRQSLAVPRESLLAIASPNVAGKEFALHPSLGRVKQLYENDKAALVANVGTLQQPTTKQDYKLNFNSLPDGLFSHSDQQRQWHTSLPDRTSTSGWLGRLSDLLTDLNGPQNFASAISVSGINVMQSAAGTFPYVIGPGGSRGLREWNEARWAHGQKAVNSQLDLEYENLLQKLFIRRKKNAIELNEVFRDALESVPGGASQFGGGKLSDQLKMVSRVIKAREELGVRRQTFFVMLDGWDLHSDLLNPHESLLDQLDSALGDFHAALNGDGLADQVTTFTASDFGRSLTSNGQGSDHGWGGNQLVMGGAVDGGKIFGEYPELYVDNPLDVGRGRMIPTTSVDEYFAEMACWFGLSKPQLSLVFPNLNRFYDIANPEPPLGFMKV